ncbi:hypothetical protein WJX81_008426 [Elliptochloris bilobata]|uniref:Uncharacterized protein n=1 Tax=Elliptochloris bilobata TaxID=381761 RepID=A0AAW1RM03_9CHLO
MAFRWGTTASSSTGQGAGSTPVLDPRMCERASLFRVCSHQATGVDLCAAVANGSLQAHAKLYGRGVTCCHLDALATADGALLATRAARL